MKEFNPITVTRAFLPPKEEFIREIDDIWDSHWLTNMGPKHQKLETALKEYLNVKNISLCVNGHMSLELILRALDIKGEVITTPFTFVSTTHAIVQNGLTPVFCDIDPRDFTIDVSQIEELITPNTSAIVPVHVYGNICQVEEIQKIASRYGLKVIYDAAHAFGETWKGAGVGNFGDASIFSFHATKVYNTVEGGAVTFSDRALYQTLYDFKNFGIESEENIVSIGGNAKMSEFHAAMGICNLRHIEENIKKREKIDGHYRELLSDIPGIYIPAKQPEVKKNYSYFPVVIDEKKFGAARDIVYEELKRHNIFTRKYFYPLTNQTECYREKYGTQETPIASYISDRVLALPIYDGLALRDVDRICDNLLKLRK